MIEHFRKISENVLCPESENDVIHIAQGFVDTSVFLHITFDLRNPEKLIGFDALFIIFPAKAMPEFSIYEYGEFNASVGDLVIMGKTVQNDLKVMVAAQGSTSEKQLLYLFGLEEVDNRFVVRDYREDYADLGFAGRYILESIGVEINIPNEPDYLALMLDRFGLSFPSTAIFLEFARSTVLHVSPLDDPDGALMSWWEREGELLRVFERAVVGEKIREGFREDVDAFLKFALTVINRRKSRAGHSFENHLRHIFDVGDVKYSKGAKTERNNRPDFIFPLKTRIFL